jgi:hypothetical protein
MAEVKEVISEKPVRNNHMKTISYNQQVNKNAEATKKLNAEAVRLPTPQRKVYTEVFNAYLSPNALSFLNQNGIDRSTVAALYA